MTLCLAAIAQNNLITVSDTMVSIDDWGYDGVTSKTARLPTMATILMAGDLAAHSEILEAIRDYVMPSNTEINSVPIGALANRYSELVNETYYARQRANILSRQYGLTPETLLTTPMSPEWELKIETNLKEIKPPPLEALLVGYDERQRPQIYKYTHGELTHQNNNAWATIGSGWELADHRLMELEYSSGMTLSDGLFHCYDAKRYSQTTRHVGETTRLSYMTPTAFCAVPHHDGTLEALYQNMKAEVKLVSGKIRKEWYDTLKESKDID